MASPPRSLVKRPRTSPTCSTPIRPHKRRYLRELAENENLLAPRRKLLTPTLEAESVAESSKGPGNWDHQEVKALVIFILFHCKGDSWPCHKRMEVWDEAGKFIKMKCGSQHLRSGTTFDNYFLRFNVHYIYVSAGSACRYKVIGWLKKKFGNPREAELHYGLCENQHRSVQTDLSLLHHREDITSSLSACVTVSSSVQTEQSGEQLSFDDNIEYLSAVFSQLCEKELGVQIPKDFLVFASSAMLRLAMQNRSNILYNLAKGIGTMRKDGSDSRFPTQRMPIGLVEYTASFFVADDLNQVLLN